MAVLPSHKEGLVYLEHARLTVRDGLVSMARQSDAKELYWALPVGNIAVLLLGPGTNLTQQAARRLGSEGVLVAFVGGGATPVYFASLSEYRSPVYMQGWIAMWADERRRLEMAKSFAATRCQQVKLRWHELFADEVSPQGAIDRFARGVSKSLSTPELLGFEGRFTVELYRLMSQAFDQKNFVRMRPKPDKKTKILKSHAKKRPPKSANELLDSGNYLAYGIAACALWILGLSHSLPLSHGLQRRGALVFDVADLIKDAYILPQAFLSFARGDSFGQFRTACVERMNDDNVLAFLLGELKKACLGAQAEIEGVRHATDMCRQ